MKIKSFGIENNWFFLCFFTDGGLGAGTITSRWPPVGAGPTLGPADTNGAGVDAKHLDVGDMSDVSDVSI